MRHLVLLALLSLIPACTTATATAEKPCVQQLKMAGLRKIEVTNQGKWCGFAIDYWNVADAGSASISAQPKHGEARIRTTKQSVRFEYRPSSGYVGSDEFELVMMESVHGRVQVDVVPLPGTN